MQKSIFTVLALILDLPEKIASDKGIRIIVCIDEFQQLAEMDGYA